ncbi:MAG: hypothetical protein ACE37K_11145 [Planctomycetota bacterium]
MLASEMPAWAVTTMAWIGGIAAVVMAAVVALTKIVPKIGELSTRFRALARRESAKIDAKIQFEESIVHMRRVRTIEAVVHRWITESGFQRCLLLTANNGGDAWNAGPLTVRCQAQRAAPGEPNTIELWRRFEADSWYRDFLGRLLESLPNRTGVALECPVEEDPDDPGQPHGTLRHQYVEQGTCASIVLPFAWRASAQLWYVSINFGRRRLWVDGDPESQEPGMRTGRFEPIPEDERAQFVAAMRQVFESPARCRGLIIELEQVFETVRPPTAKP